LELEGIFNLLQVLALSSWEVDQADSNSLGRNIWITRANDFALLAAIGAVLRQSGIVVMFLVATDSAD
jgi:hypothetical protein